MEFEAHDTLRDIIKTDCNIEVDKVEGYNLINLEGYKEYLRVVLSNYHKECANNIRECVDEITRRYYLIQLDYMLSKWQALQVYAKQKTEYVLIDRKDVVNSANELHVKEFLREKERYCKKVIDEINRQINTLTKHTVNSNASSPKKVKVFSDDDTVIRNTGFLWKKSPTLRGIFFSQLKEHKLIPNDIALDRLKLAFPLADFGDIHEPIKIIWAALTERSNDFHKGALVYLISELVRNGFIKDHEIKIRNKKIIHCFVDDEGNKIKNLNNARIPTEGNNKEAIDLLIQKLIAEQRKN